MEQVKKKAEKVLAKIAKIKSRVEEIPPMKRLAMLNGGECGKD